MPYLIKEWETAKNGYTFGVPTFYNSFHLGTDKIVPIGTPIYAPFDCNVQNSVGTEGGNTLTITYGNWIIRCMHLSKFANKGNVKEGTIIGYSGNTGTSTAPHIHVDISHAPFNLYSTGNFIDPMKFDWKPAIIDDMKTLHDFVVDGMPADDRIAALKTQVGGLHDTNSTLTNTANDLKNTNDDLKRQIMDAVHSKNEMYNNWQGEIDARHRAEKDRDVCQAGAVQNSTLLQKIKMLFG